MSSDHTLPSQGGITLLEKANSALSTDFCPWANKYVYWLKNPVTILSLAIVGSVLCGVFLNPLVFLITGLLVLVTGVGVVLPWIAVCGITCQVFFDIPRTQVGRAARVRLRVTNKWPIPVWGLSLIRGFALNTGADGDEGVALARVPGWSTVEYSWAFTPRRRGLYPNETATVETGFPFGLIRAQKEATVEGSLIVWPECVRLDGMPDTSESQNTEEQLSDRRTGDFGDMMGTRPFRPGDSLRRVHWAQTARQQTMIVTERQAPALTSVRVVLDVAADSFEFEFSDSVFELCVSTAASVCDSLHRQHSRVELILGRDVYVAGDSSVAFHRLMDAVAVADRTADQWRQPPSRTQFEIRVTTAAGAIAGCPRQVVVGEDSPSAWITVRNPQDLRERFPGEWRRLCHAS